MEELEASLQETFLLITGNVFSKFPAFGGPVSGLGAIALLSVSW